MRSLSNPVGGRSPRRSVLSVVLALGVALVLMFSASDPPQAKAGAARYSAYSDPTKTALSFVLSDEGNVEEFRDTFGLKAGEVEEVLAAVGEENETLAEEYAESERLVGANKGLPDGRIAGKIDASDYDERVRAAIAATKGVVEAAVPEDRRSDFEAWIDARWLGEVEEAQRPQTVQDRTTTSRAAQGLTCRVFATQYVGYTRYEVALPHRALKFDGGVRVRVTNPRGDRRAWAPVKEVGPWNTYDNYWQTGRYRSMWKDLSQCVPEARAAYYNNYNRGEDEYGRKVLNPAGVDLTPAVARELGLAKYENAWVDVYFPWMSR